MDLLERAAELETLERAFAAGGRLVLVAGEAGVGKTALLRRFCAQRPVLWGACDPLFTQPPLGPLFDVAAQTGGELADVVEQGAPAPAAAAALLGELDRRDGAIVVLEDLHWADEATLDLLRLLGRRIATARALVIASYRDDELERAHPLQITLGELSRHRAIDRLRLEPLSLDAVTELAAPYGVDPAALHRRTGGNAFFVTEALAAGGVELPATIRDAVLARVQLLTPEAQRVLEAAAIVPGTAELGLLEALAGKAVSHLEECLAYGMLGPAGTGVAFRHELAHAVVADAVAPHQRLTLHRAALAALTGHADPARLAYHAERAGDGEAALRFARPAAERAAAAGAHREAAAQYARALRFADALPPRERARLHERRAHECYLADRPLEGADDLERALECYRALGDRRGEGDALRALSTILWCPGAGEEAQRAGRDAVAVLEPLGPGRELAMAYANMASVAMNYEDARGTEEWAPRALELARTLGDEPIEQHVLNSAGTMEFLVHGPDARATGEQSLELALRLGGIDDILRSYSNLAWAALRHRAYPLADRYLEAATASSTDPELDVWRIYLLGYGARSQFDQGRWDDAAEAATVVLHERRASPLPVVIALSVLGRLRARRRDPDPWAPLDEALSLAGEELQRIEPVAVARAETAWLEGDRQGVAAETDRIAALARRCDARWVIGELACWRRRAEIEEDVPDDLPEPYALELAGDHEQASVAWAALGCPYEAAVALAGADDEALLRRGYDELLALGATGAAAILGRRAREHGATGLSRQPRTTTRNNPGQLTARELEILGLVADGLRNRDIAERLFLSPRTVAHHVSAIMRKLGARTRGEAAAYGARLGVR